MTRSQLRKLFAKMAPSMTEAQRERLLDANRKAIADSARQAAAEYVSVLLWKQQLEQRQRTAQ